MKLVQATLFATVACATVLGAQGAGPRRDGNWQVTIQMEMPGLPQQMPPMVTTQCITKEEAADPQKSLPQRPQRGGMPDQCKVSDYKTDGNKITWSVRCEGQNAMTGTGEAIYKDDTYTGAMVMNMTQNGQPMTMTMKVAGKRLGDCVK